MRMHISVFKTEYLFSAEGICDILSLLPALTIFHCFGVDRPGVIFLPMLRILRVLRLVRTIKVIKLVRSQSILDFFSPLKLKDYHDSPLNAKRDELIIKVVYLAVGIILGLFVIASLLFCLVQIDPNSFSNVAIDGYDMSTQFTLFDSIYFVMVMASTLGFGDFVPTSNIGQAFVILGNSIKIRQLNYLISLISHEFCAHCYAL